MVGLESSVEGGFEEAVCLKESLPGGKLGQKGKKSWTF